jgi:hypothetical protein
MQVGLVIILTYAPNSCIIILREWEREPKPELRRNHLSPTINKTRYRTHDDIMSDPKDELEIEYRNAELRQQADQIQSKFEKQPTVYRALLEELAQRELSKTPKQNQIIAEDNITEDTNADQLL